MDSPRSDTSSPPASELHAWFAEDVLPHDSHLKAYVRGAFPSVRDVDDVVQESYLRLWRTRAGEPIRSAKAFLFTVARRVALDWVRREVRSPVVAVKDLSALFVLDEGADASSSAAGAMQVALLTEAVDALPPRCREIFLLCQVEGLPQREVARRLGLSENTVAVQSARGLKRCAAFVSRRLNRP
jgi:RNA polymerase sigma-70 factor (ECF subfamily)